MILIIGLPDAGKTTYAAQYDNVIHMDDIYGRHKYQKVIDAVWQDPALVVEGVFGKADVRKQLVQASSQHNTCIWLDVPVEECLKRERADRQRPDQMIIWAAEDFEPPTYEEGWDEIIHINNYISCT